MKYNFTIHSDKLNLICMKTFNNRKQVKQEMQNLNKRLYNNLPSAYTCSFILGYAAAIEVIKLRETIEFNILSN